MSSKPSNMKRVGTREEVWSGLARMTGGRLTKDDLMLNKRGKIVSKKMSERAKSNYPRLKARLCGSKIQEAKSVIIKDVSRTPYKATRSGGNYKGMKLKMSMQEFKEFVKNKTDNNVDAILSSYPIFDLDIVKNPRIKSEMIHGIRRAVEYNGEEVELKTLTQDIGAFNAYI